MCFRCGVGGDVIAFVQQLEQVSFREAAAHLGAELPGPAARRTRAPYYATGGPRAAPYGHEVHCPPVEWWPPRHSHAASPPR